MAKSGESVVAGGLRNLFYDKGCYQVWVLVVVNGKVMGHTVLRRSIFAVEPVFIESLTEILDSSSNILYVAGAGEYIHHKLGSSVEMGCNS